jgi:hypothetical protein
MIDNRTIRTMTEPVAKSAHWRNNQTDKRMAVATDKRTIGCMSRHKAGQPTNKLTGQYANCTFEQLIGQAYRQLYPCMFNRTNGQLTALAAISIIN